MEKCPNKSHPDWKALVEKHGENEAYRMYVENDYNIPDIDGARKTKRRKDLVDHGSDLRGDYYAAKSTLDNLEKNPEEAAGMVDEVKKSSPELRIVKETLFNEDGSWKDTSPEQEGKHYKNAVTSAVAYANDSYLEKVPGEYFEAYIDMYQETPLMKAAIEKYGVERLMKLMGRKVEGNEMSPSFNEFSTNFWKQVRGDFGSPNVKDLLTDSFANNDRLGVPLSRGTSIYNHQEVEEPLYKKSYISDFNEETKRSGKVTIKSDQEVLKDLKNDFIEKFVITEDGTANVYKFDLWWEGLKNRARAATKLRGKKDVTNYAGIDESFIVSANKLFLKSDAVKRKMLEKVMGKEDVKLADYEQEVMNTVLNLIRAINHKNEINSSYLDTNGKIIFEKQVNDIIEQELTTTFNEREDRLKSKHKYVRDFVKMLDNSILSKFLRNFVNTRLWSKYLSGSESSLFSRVVYKGLNEARETRAKFSQDFADFFKSKPTSFFNGSTFHNPKNSIDQLETVSFQLDKQLDNTASSVRMTKSELFNIYLMARQPNAKSTLLEKGFHLKKLEGRDANVSSNYILSEDQLNGIISTIENDPESKALINEVDQAMDYNYKEVNGVFRLLNGYNLDKIDDYFPVSHGTEGFDIRKEKSVVENMSSLRLRKGTGGPLMIQDAFQVLSNVNLVGASYVAHAIPLHNAQKGIDSIRDSFTGKDKRGYIEGLQGTIDKIQDSGTLYSTQGDTDFSRAVNKVQGNFAVAVLAKNIGVVFKQQVSLITAQEEINVKYIRKAGASLGPVPFINPIKLLRQISFTGVKGGDTWMPVEWNQLTKDADYNALLKYPLFRERFQGAVSRETGEAVMGKNLSEDKVKIPFIKDKQGNPVTITKSRLMRSITIMDTLTIVRLYSAVKLETQDRMGEPEFRNMTDEQLERHNVNRLQEIVDKTQPTFDQTNRTGWSQMSNPLARALTMFSSATSKMSMLLIDGAISFGNNPSKENGIKLFKRVLNMGVTASVMLTTIDLLRHMLLNGWDDEQPDEILQKYAFGSLKSTVGSIQGVGTALNIVLSNLDDTPWSQTVQDPFHYTIQTGSEGVADLLKGDFERASKNLIGSYFRLKGGPLSLYSNSEKIVKRVLE